MAEFVELQSLKKQRTVLKRKRTLLKSFININTNINNLPENVYPDKKLLIEIETRMENESNMFHKFEDLQDQIDEIDDSDEQYIQIYKSSFTKQICILFI